jgi:hypothetical protein
VGGVLSVVGGIVVSAGGVVVATGGGVVVGCGAVVAGGAAGRVGCTGVGRLPRVVSGVDGSPVGSWFGCCTTCDGADGLPTGVAAEARTGEFDGSRNAAAITATAAAAPPTVTSHAGLRPPGAGSGT